MPILLASSNPGKLREYQSLAARHSIEFAPFPNLTSLPAFAESAPTFAENAAGKALHYSRLATLAVLADDSGLVVPALAGAPGVNSARYAGPNATDSDRIAKLLTELPPRFRRHPARPASTNHETVERPAARFISVLALARQGRVLAVFSDSVQGELLDAPRGTAGFGYDPIFFFPPLAKTFAEIPREEKNQISHRGRAFAKLLRYLLASEQN